MVMSKLSPSAFLSLFVITILLMSIFAASADAADEKKVALVIGNNEYTNATPLDNPRNDAEAIAHALVRLNYDTVLSTDLDQEGMQRTLRNFEERIRDADVALFYYAGHGLQTHGKNYLVSTNADLKSESDLHFNTVDLQIILDFMQDPDRTNIIILDACRDNPLAEELALSLPKSRSNNSAQGLAKVESGVGTLVAFATAPGEVALDGEGEHSPFGQSLLKHIETPGLEVRQLFSRVRDDVYRSTNGIQVPWDNSSLRSDFYFKQGIKLASAERSHDATIEPTKTENLFWETIKDDTAPENYVEFLRLFPKSVFASVAKRRLAVYPQSNEQQSVLQVEATPNRPVLPVAEAKPQAIKALAPQQVHDRKARVTSIDIPLAKSIADGWQRRTYNLRGNNVHGCHGTGKETASVGDWGLIEPGFSPIKLKGRYEDSVYTFSAKTFDIAADLGVQAEDGEILLVEYKKTVGLARAWCAYESLSKGLFSDMLAGSDYYSGQTLVTTKSGFKWFGWMEFAFGLVSVKSGRAPHNCMTFIGLDGSRRIDGFYCRDIGGPIDASEVDSILRRIKVEGVIG